MSAGAVAWVLSSMPPLELGKETTLAPGAAAPPPHAPGAAHGRRGIRGEELLGVGLAMLIAEAQARGSTVWLVVPVKVRSWRA